MSAAARALAEGTAATDAAAIAKEIPVHLDGGGDVAGLEIGEPGADVRVQARQGVEGYRREGVMLGVIGHVPREEPHDGQRARGARVLEAVPREGAGGVLGQKIRAEEGLTDQERGDPYHERQWGS